jgi:hypothetical protein
MRRMTSLAIIAIAIIVNIRSSINSLLKISLQAWFPYDEDEDEDEEDDFPRDNCHCNY